MSLEQIHVLVVDDDLRIRELLRRYLADKGFLVSTAGDAADARAKLASLDFDLIVMDVMMPGESGLELTRSLRQIKSTPILLLTAMGEAENRIAGLECGADDYLSKPFEPRELVLRINNIMRRVGTAPVATDPIRLGDHVFDPEREELSKDGHPVRLTGAEASLLSVLSRSPGEVLSREVLIERCRISGSTRTVDVLVTRMRRKIEPDPRAPRYLQTVRGQGYILRPDERQVGSQEG